MGLFSCSLQKYIEGRKLKGLTAGCEDYKWLYDSERKTTYKTRLREYRCDNIRDYSRPCDWQGANWYRIHPSIGTKIPTSPTKFEHCGTKMSGWISGGSSP